MRGGDSPTRAGRRAVPARSVWRGAVMRHPLASSLQTRLKWMRRKLKIPPSFFRSGWLRPHNVVLRQNSRPRSIPLFTWQMLRDYCSLHPRPGYTPWHGFSASRIVFRKVMANTLPSQRKKKYVINPHTDVGQRHLYWRRPRPRASHRRSDSSIPLTDGPIRRPSIQLRPCRMQGCSHMVLLRS